MDFEHPDLRTAAFMGVLRACAERAEMETRAAGQKCAAGEQAPLKVGDWTMTPAERTAWDADKSKFFGDHWYAPLLSKLADFEWGRKLIGWLVGSGFGGDALKGTVANYMQSAATNGQPLQTVNPRSFAGVMFQDPRVHKALMTEMASYAAPTASALQQARLRAALEGGINKTLNKNAPGLNAPLPEATAMDKTMNSLKRFGHVFGGNPLTFWKKSPVDPTSPHWSKAQQGDENMIQTWIMDPAARQVANDYTQAFRENKPFVPRGLEWDHPIQSAQRFIASRKPEWFNSRIASHIADGMVNDPANRAALNAKLLSAKPGQQLSDLLGGSNLGGAR